MKKLVFIGTAVAAIVAATSAFAYDGTKCKAPGNCWEPKPGFPDKVAGSKYDHESLRGIAAAGERDGALDRATGWESQSQIRDRLGSDDNVWEDSTSRLSWRPGGDVVRSGRDRGRLENASRVSACGRIDPIGADGDVRPAHRSPQRIPDDA